MFFHTIIMYTAVGSVILLEHIKTSCLFRFSAVEEVYFLWHGRCFRFPLIVRVNTKERHSSQLPRARAIHAQGERSPIAATGGAHIAGRHEEPVFFVYCCCSAANILLFLFSDCVAPKY